ncbi:DNA alkylation repair protein, partial [Kitasatospora sp. NPDC058263]
MNPERVARIGREVQAVVPRFDAQAFVAGVTQDLPHLELKARIARTARGLHDHLPIAGPDALEVLVRSLPASPEAAGLTNDFGLHIYSPHSAYVAAYHRDPSHLDQALAALRAFTRYFSAEDAVRYFLRDFPNETMANAAEWAADPDYRVRRLAGESTRPQLPWSIAVDLPTGATVPLLDTLHPDEHRFVTTSVANHLRDIARTDRDLVLPTLARWRAEGRATTKNLDFIARNALKTQLKDGWPPAYAFLGYDIDAPVTVGPLHLEHSEFHVDDVLAFTAELTVPADTPVHVLYVITRTTPGNGKQEKFHQLANRTPRRAGPLNLAKQHKLRSTTHFVITPGQYRLAL